MRYVFMVRSCSPPVTRLLVLVEVVEPGRGFGIGSNRIVHGIRSITSHSTAFFSSTFSTVNTLLTVFGA